MDSIELGYSEFTYSELLLPTDGASFFSHLSIKNTPLELAFDLLHSHSQTEYLKDGAFVSL
jgi:hypothetical protein